MSKRPRSSARASEPERLELPDGSELERIRRYHAELGAFLERVDSPQPNSAFEKASLHARRHFPLYALVALFALVVILVPTVNHKDNSTNASQVTGQGTDTGTGDALGPATSAGNSTTGIVGSSGSQAAGVVPGVGSGGVGPVAKVVVGGGTTIGGFACKPGVHQIPWSTYAPPCVGKFSGSNGGKTYNGVDAKTVKVVIRHWAVDQGNVADTQNAAQGRATRAQAVVLLNKWSSWFAKVFDLYGRKLVFVDYNSKTSNAVNEAQSKGEQEACADATAIAQNVKAFADLGYGTSFIETQPFADCATRQKLFVPFGASYFPESYFKKWDPYVWHVYTECERIGHDVAEYMGKRLLNRNATWAKDALYQKKKRVFGVYVPDNAGYQRCVNITETDFQNKYHGTVKSRFNYALDVTRFPEEAARAVVQFKADGVTTLVNACDTLSTQFLAEAADKQQWGPEWFIIGVATQDTDGAARTWNQNVVAGHLFGMSQLGKSALIEGPNGEAGQSWRAAFGKEKPPTGYGDAYYRILLMYTMLQAAGPVLTPANIARGLRSLPTSGGAHGAFGSWSFKTSHTSVIDSREVFYLGTAKGYDGKDGAYVETYGGKRFTSGQWPAEEPKVYPK